MGKEKCKKKLN